MFGTGSHQMPSVIRLSSRRENFRLVVRNDSLLRTAKGNMLCIISIKVDNDKLKCKKMFVFVLNL